MDLIGNPGVLPLSLVASCPAPHQQVRFLTSGHDSFCYVVFGLAGKSLMPFELTGWTVFSVGKSHYIRELGKISLVVECLDLVFLRHRECLKVEFYKEIHLTEWSCCQIHHVQLQ